MGAVVLPIGRRPDTLKDGSTSSIMSVMSQKAVVKKELLWEIVGDDFCQVRDVLMGSTLIAVGLWQLWPPPSPLCYCQDIGKRNNRVTVLLAWWLFPYPWFFGSHSHPVSPRFQTLEHKQLIM
ncbi:hypothetical protein JRQ81_009140 [Phrynocephalus forsythii]|uniref:Uncharacterized protein n=1 Tax=Phrynocephalus forsythii TaxID=171643 RepID=A0A9Q0X9U7_9SAUR|nr:hypothetical protein JRQ81_009140 [Phrynocephalus forsythii]